MVLCVISYPEDPQQQPLALGEGLEAREALRLQGRERVPEAAVLGKITPTIMTTIVIALLMIIIVKVISNSSSNSSPSTRQKCIHIHQYIYIYICIYSIYGTTCILSSN